jgi:hypothetical protein
MKRQTDHGPLLDSDCHLRCDIVLIRPICNLSKNFCIITDRCDSWRSNEYGGRTGAVTNLFGDLDRGLEALELSSIEVSLNIDIKTANLTFKK